MQAEPSDPMALGSDICDAHIHVFGPRDRFDFVPDRRYTPPDAVLADYRAAMAPLGITRAVLSQPSIHGLDNSALLRALDEGAGTLRGIVMVTPSVTDDELRRYHSAGVRGLRTQIKSQHGKPVDFDELRRLGERVRPLGWHVEIHVDVGQVPDIDRQCADFPVPVVIEHMGHLPADLGVETPGFQALLRLLAGDDCWVILSGAYINSRQSPPHHDIRPYLDALLSVAPERSMWASNWPHPHQDPVPDDRLLLSAFVDWVRDEKLLAQILTDNAVRLYDFPTN